jgi:hypothetical protein
MNQHVNPWSAEETTIAIESWNAGKTLTEIGEELGRTRASVQSALDRIARSGVKFTRPKQSQVKAPTPAVLSEIRRLFCENGLGTDRIAKQLNMGRDHVRALVRSHKWQKPIVVRQVKAVEPRAEKVEHKPRPPRMEVFSPLPGSTPRIWTERPPLACKWPVGGDGADLVSCCEPAPSGTYCEAHRAIAFAASYRKPPEVPGRGQRARRFGT